MSMTPNNPFEGNQPDQGNTLGPQKTGSNIWLWVFGIIGVVVVVGALVCCGGAYFVYRAGTGAVAEVFKDQLNGNPVIDEHIGQIESLEFSLSATTEAAETSQGAIAFSIKGSKGSGTILIKQDQRGGEVGIASAELTMSDGSKYEVPIEESQMVPEAMEDIEIDFGEVDDVIQKAEKELQNAEATLKDSATDQ